MEQTVIPAPPSESPGDAIDAIVAKLDVGPILCRTFVHWAIDRKTDFLTGKLPGLVLGAAVGGTVGEMIFGGTLLSKSQATYLGELGILVVTHDQVVVGHLTAPFESFNGRITGDHLKFFLKNLENGKLTRKTFNIRETQVQRTVGRVRDELTLTSGTNQLSCRTSELYVDGVLRDTLDGLTTVRDVHARLGELQPLATPREFVAKLENREAAITEDQYQDLDMPTTNRYVWSLFDTIAKSPKRDVLVENLSYLPSSVNGALWAAIELRARSYRKLTWIFGIAAMVTILGTAGSCFGVVNPFFPIMGAIVGFRSGDALLRSRWCRSVLGTR